MENRHMGDYAKALGSKLRGIRQQQGLSLHGVEQKSGGRWKAVVVGSYERGDRAVTVQKLAELADFYGVPVVELLPEGRVPSGAEPATKIVINLERLQ
jgi:transcriptional regulator with XRE-family HTH domain